MEKSKRMRIDLAKLTTYMKPIYPELDISHYDPNPGQTPLRDTDEPGVFIRTKPLGKVYVEITEYNISADFNASIKWFNVLRSIFGHLEWQALNE